MNSQTGASSDRSTLAGLALALLCVVNACHAHRARSHRPVASPTPQLSQPQGLSNPSRTPPLAEGRPPTGRERAVIRKLMTATSRLRELPFIAEIDIRVQSREQIISHAQREMRQDDLEASRRAYVALRMLDPAVDIMRLMLGLLGEQVLGYYAPTTKTLVVRDDVMTALGRGSRSNHAESARKVLVHELVHALQDQHLALSSHLASELTTDQGNAWRAIIEGDATLTATAYAMQRAGDPWTALLNDPLRLQALIDAMSDAAEQSPKFSSVPAIVSAPLLFYYQQGLVFAVDRLSRDGTYAALNTCIQQPPPATSSVLHPTRQTPQSRSPLESPPSTHLLDRGYHLETTDTLGELELSIYLRPGNGHKLANIAASAWTADTLQIYQPKHGAEPVALWLIQARSSDTAHVLAEAVRTRNRVLCNDCPDVHVSQDRRTVIVQHGIPKRWTRQIAGEAVSSQLDPPQRAH